MRLAIFLCFLACLMVFLAERPSAPSQEVKTSATPAPAPAASKPAHPYQTPSGRACTHDDWAHQFLHGRKSGEEECLVAGVHEWSDRERAANGERAKQEELKANCVLLSRTPMSAMSPKDLDDWDFCKAIMVRR